MKEQADTMESYIMKLISECQLRLNDSDISKDSFQYYSGARDFLYMVLTGHDNPQSNPKSKQKYNE